MSPANSVISSSTIQVLPSDGREQAPPLFQTMWKPEKNGYYRDITRSYCELDQIYRERDRFKAIVAASRRSETTRWQITGQRYPRVEGG